MVVSKEKQIDMYTKMYKARAYEERIYFMFLEGIVPGTVHQAHGEEATAVGVLEDIRKDDWIFSTHRNACHAVAKGLPLKSMMAEMFAKETGCCRGRGGAMHIGDPEWGMAPSSGILGTTATHPTGAALAFKLQGKDNVAIGFFGDGASNEGAVYEAMNFAQLRKLPVVFVCENNWYGASTHVKLATAAELIEHKARAYDMEAHTVDGNDVFAVYEVATKAIEKARAGEGPTFLVLNTYRIAGHSRNDSNDYRDKEEEKWWLEHDPIKLMEERMLKEGTITQEEIDKIQEAVEAEIDEAVEYALASPSPKVEDVLQGVYYEGGKY